MSSTPPSAIPFGKLVSVTSKAPKTPPHHGQPDSPVPASLEAPPPPASPAPGRRSVWLPYLAVPLALLLGFTLFLALRHALSGPPSDTPNSNDFHVVLPPPLDPASLPSATPAPPTPDPTPAPAPKEILASAAPAAEPEITPLPSETPVEAPPVPVALKDLPLEPTVADIPPRDERPILKEPAPKAPEAAAACEKFGTSIVFVKHPPDAFKQAKEEKKLVFFIHLSGNFEDKEFT